VGERRPSLGFRRSWRSLRGSQGPGSFGGAHGNFQPLSHACRTGFARADRGAPLLILASGFTYDHQYWDLPVDGGKYSFVDAANRAGYATLNLDRLGLGSSDKPPAS
jgi:hypothetical protein